MLLAEFALCTRESFVRQFPELFFIIRAELAKMVKAAFQGDFGNISSHRLHEVFTRQLQTFVFNKR